jgi:hypothetical protein
MQGSGVCGEEKISASFLFWIEGNESEKAFVHLGYVKRYKRNMFIDSKQHTTRIGSLMLH